MQEKISEILKELKSKTKEIADGEQLKKVKAEFLGKKGEITHLLKNLGDKAVSERKELGKKINELKDEALDYFEKKQEEIVEKREKSKEKIHDIDITLPRLKPSLASRQDVGVRKRMTPIGMAHPLSITLEETVGFFEKRGFIAVSGPEIENEYYNFGALNIPENHPARREQDSFYLDKKHVLRTQTSNMQIRVGEKTRPPIAIVSPGKVFRRDSVDATHSYFFHQMEGMWIDGQVSFAHLKGILTQFCKSFFGSSIRLRFRPDFFPFTEPSLEVSIEYEGRSEGWLEILGAGIIHPNVLKNMDIDPEKFSGLAFGIGIERLAMLKYGIEDIRHFYENDLLFLHQFN